MFLVKSKKYSLYFSIFSVFHSFSPYFRSYSVCFSFCTFFSVSRHIISYHVSFSFSSLSLFSLYYKFYNVSFSFSLLVSLIATFQVLQWAFLIFHVFQCFLPYSKSDSIHVFQFSHQNPGPTLCISHTSHFTLFLSIFKSYSVCDSFSTYFQFSCHNPVFIVCISHI